MFYGWYIVVAGMLIMTAWSGLLMYGFTAWVNPIAALFGWSYVQISLSRTFQSIERAALAPLVGMAVDRWPAKWLMFSGIAVIGLGLLCLSQATSLTMFYISFLIIGLGSSFGFYMVITTTIARWFKKNIGKANAVMVGGTAIGGLLVPVVAKVIDNYGWQISMIIFAVAIWVVGIPLSFVFRSRPEDYGLLPDGKPPPEDLKDSGSSQTYEFSLGVKEAIKTRAFWLINIAFMLQMATVGAVIVHLMPYLVSLGIDRTTASMITMIVLLVSLPARFTYGWLADIFKKKYISATSMALTSVGLFFLSIVKADSLALIILFIAIYAIGLAGMDTLRPPMLREHFGTKKFGTIFGLSGIFFTIGYMATPPLAGWVFDMRGVYDPIWLILSGVCMIGAILISTISPTTKPSSSLPAS